MRGKLIVIEGLDGSGKATQAKLLCSELQGRGLKVMQVSFPNYQSPSSAPIKMYLNGDFGSKPGDTGAYAASCLYTVDRFAGYKTMWQGFYEAGGIVIADRYTTSNAIHQCSKLDTAQWDEYLEWLFDFEYNKVELPSPSAVIYLDVATDISQELMSSRYRGNEAQKDIHERDVEYLNSSRRAALYCVDKLQWSTINCMLDGRLRNVQEIHKDIMSCLAYENII